MSTMTAHPGRLDASASATRWQGVAMRATLAADRLYALSIRPQEWDGLREHAELAWRWGPLADDREAPATRHWFLLVLECRVRPPAGDPLAEGNSQGLEVLRCGWEAELELPVALPPAGIDEDRTLIAALFAKIAETVNSVGGRAGVGELLTAAMCQKLVEARN
jgi:hypothetical protein